MTRKAVSIVLMITGAAVLIGIGLFAVDKATSAEPDGLGTWIFTMLGLILGASTGIKGWVEWNKKESAQGTKNVAFDEGQIATGEGAKNIQLKDSSHYVEHYHEAPKPEVPSFHPLHQLPQPPADFTGRDELIEQLVADFENGKGANITGPAHGLTGMGGIGKTALGLVVAHRIADGYPDAQIFLDLKGTTASLSAMDVMRHVITSFEPGADLRALNETNMGSAYRSVLHGRRALLFFDNARSAEQIAPLRPPETCAMLVTSRWNFTVPGLHPRRVDLLSEENAITFLLELCPRAGEQAAGLGKACACLPLALRIAGSFLGVHADWPVEKYIAQLNDRKRRLPTLKESREDAELTTEPDLLATFELSYNALAGEDQRRWRMLGVFPISFDGNAASAMWDLDDEQTRRLLGLLLRYSLLDYDETSSRYNLHDLLADYALSQMEADEDKEARLRHASHYKDVLNAADDLYQEGGEKVLIGLRLFDLEWENIRAGQAAVAGGTERKIAELCVAYPNAGAYVLDLRQHSKERIHWLEAALSAARDLGDRPKEANRLGSLGIAYAALGEARKAIEFYEQWLAIARELGDRRGEGQALGNLGNAYDALGEARKAIEFHEENLVIARELGDRRGEGNALGNVGGAYKNLGETRKAIEFHEQALVIHRDLGDLRGEGAALGSLGNAYYDLGEARKAIEFYEQRLAIAREIGDRRGEAIGSWNLGLEHEKLGELEKAIEAMQIRVDFEREIGHPDAEKDVAKIEELRKKLEGGG